MSISRTGRRWHAPRYSLPSNCGALLLDAMLKTLTNTERYDAVANAGQIHIEDKRPTCFRGNVNHDACRLYR